MHLLHFGTYEQILFSYVKRGLRADRKIKNETDFVFHLLSSADKKGEAVRNATPAAASRYKAGSRTIPEDIATLFCKRESRDVITEALDYIVVPCIDRGRKQQLIKDFINIVKQDTTIDEEFKATVFEEASSGQLALFLADLLIYSVCVDPTERDKEYPVEHYNLPMSNDWFTGRTKELEAVADNYADGRRIQILYGMGGMGKSQIALKYAYDHYRSYSMIHWINAHTIDSIVECYRVFLEEKRALPNVRTREGICQGYTKYMDSHSDWLIIYDNCDYYTDKEYSDFSNLCLPKNRSVGNILITSRNKRPVGKAKRMRIDSLSDEDAVSFLLQRTELDDTNGAEQLAVRLGRFPLALEIAGAYIYATPGCDFRTYIAYLGQEIKILDQMVEVTDYNETIKDILLLTLNRIKEDRHNDEVSLCVEDVLHLCAYGAPYNIDLRAFAFLPSEKYADFLGKPLNNKVRMEVVQSVCTDQLKRNELVQTLITYGLAWEQTDGFLSIHELQMEILRDYIYPQADWSRLTCLAFSNFFKTNDCVTLHHYQHETYFNKHIEELALRGDVDEFTLKFLTMRRNMTQIALLVEQFRTEYINTPKMSIAEFSKNIDSVFSAAYEMFISYLKAEQIYSRISDLNQLMSRLLYAEVLFENLFVYDRAISMMVFALIALFIAFECWGENIVISRMYGFEELLRGIRICLPLATLLGLTCSETTATYLGRLRDFLGTYAKIAHWDNKELAKHSIIIEAYIKGDFSSLPEDIVDDAVQSVLKYKREITVTKNVSSSP